MTPREQFAQTVLAVVGDTHEARLIILAADEMAAALIEKHARTPQQATDLAVRQARSEVADQIAQSIETLLCEPGEHCADRFCPDCIRHAQARDDAATARRIGQTQLLAAGAS